MLPYPHNPPFPLTTMPAYHRLHRCRDPVSEVPERSLLSHPPHPHPASVVPLSPPSMDKGHPPTDNFPTAETGPPTPSRERLRKIPPQNTPLPGAEEKPLSSFPPASPCR